MNWAVEGCREYLDIDKLAVPTIIQNEIDTYKFEQDSIAQFIEECCTTVEQWQIDYPTQTGQYINLENFKAKNPEVYKAYRRFCEQNGEYALKQRALSQKLKERGFSQQPEGGVRTWSGFRLNVEVT